MDLLGAMVLCVVGCDHGSAPTQREHFGTVHAAKLSPEMDRWHPYIAEAATRFQMLEGWIKAVMKAESGGRTSLNGQPIISPAGAMGLMQLLPMTYQDMRTQHGFGADPYEPRDNILAGVAYLRAMYDRFGYPGLFAAYNAGPERYEDYLRTGRTLPTETLNYLASLGPDVLKGVISRHSAIIPAGDLPLADGAETGLKRTLFVVNFGSSNLNSNPFSSAKPTQSGHSLFVPLSRNQPQAIPARE
jgi:hypothetical protein